MLEEHASTDFHSKCKVILGLDSETGIDGIVTAISKLKEKTVQRGRVIADLTKDILAKNREIQALHSRPDFSYSSFLRNVWKPMYEILDLGLPVKREGDTENAFLQRTFEQDVRPILQMHFDQGDESGDVPPRRKKRKREGSEESVKIVKVKRRKQVPPQASVQGKRPKIPKLSKGQEGKWQCVCGFWNRPMNEVCGGVRGKADVGCRRPRVIGYWTCNVCGFENHPLNIVCGGEGKLGCKASRPQKILTKWTCKACGFENNPHNTVCGGTGKLGCKSLRPAPDNGSNAKEEGVLGSASHPYVLYDDDEDQAPTFPSLAERRNDRISAWSQPRAPRRRVESPPRQIRRIRRRTRAPRPDVTEKKEWKLEIAGAPDLDRLHLWLNEKDSYPLSLNKSPSGQTALAVYTTELELAYAHGLVNEMQEFPGHLLSGWIC